MELLQNHSLQSYNTFGLPARAAHFAEVHSEKALVELLQEDIRPLFILGGGSNILLTKDLPGLVIRNAIAGKAITRTFRHCVYVSFGGGENWHQAVLWSIEQGLGGIENLSLIPGTVGAAPIQNIGAYGVELKDVFVRLEAIDLSSGKKRIFRKKDCHFGYRDSIFKRAAKGRYCITRVVLRLQKASSHRLNTRYGAIRQTLAEMGIEQASIADLSQAVIHIRSSKLPDPAKLGNAGSFFKNPEIAKADFVALQEQYPQVPHYPMDSGLIKVPAGWLIEQAGWKGKRIGAAGSHAKQALVLVNYGGATGSDIWQLALDIIASVKAQFGIELSAEVNVI
ncbi:MAG: UDP-N-acetylmuramate dehydrogenase [Bacteroidota bacterium]